MKIEPSSTYVTEPSASVQPTEVSRPSAGGGQVEPTLASTKLPVPYVFLAMPGAVQAWPNSAACWSPATPAMTSPSGAPKRAEVTPNRPLDGSTAGRTSSGTPSRSAIAADHDRVLMSNSIVRLAFDGSVAWTSPPVSFQISQLSIVPMARSARSTSRCSSSQDALVPEKYGSSTNPVTARTWSRAPAATSSSQ